MSEINITLHAPSSGYILPLSDIPDATFAQKMVGDGFAIEPFDATIYAPVSGQIKDIAPTKHAITIATDAGVDVLIHFGLETVALKGQGFDVKVTQGDQVTPSDPLWQVDLDLIASKAISLATPVIVVDYQGADLVLNCYGYQAYGTEVVHVCAQKSDNQLAIDTTQQAQQSITLTNPNGIHARPASQIVALARQYPGTIIELKAPNGKCVFANQMIEIMQLGLKQGDVVVVTATGQSSEQAADAIATYITQLTEAPLSVNEQQVTYHQDPYQGQPAAKGLAIGQLKALDQALSFNKQSHLTYQDEQARLKKAISDYQGTLNLKIQQVYDTEQSLLQAHQALLGDDDLWQQALHYLEKGATAEFAWDQSVNQVIQQFQTMENVILQQRVEDLKDLRKQIIQTLIGACDHMITFDQPTILYAEHLTLSDMLNLDQQVVGLVTRYGGMTSHVAIVANNQQRPLLINVQADLTQHLEQICVLDAQAGRILPEPDQTQLADYQQRLADQQVKQQQAIEQANVAAQTQDGHRVGCYLNIQSASELSDHCVAQADGVGLFRTEMLYEQFDQPPSVEQQKQHYQAVCNYFHENEPIMIRVLDAGGDKPIQCLDLPDEANPFLGVRGIRYGLAHPEILKTQLTALLQTQQSNIHIMLPMVSQLDEVRQVKKLYQTLQSELAVSVNQPIGIMVEVPSVVMQAGQFADEVDFMSVGTNDLAQYILAMDRGHEKLAEQADHAHPAVLKAIWQLIESVGNRNVKISVCGLMAADPELIPLLIGMGIDHLSMTSGQLATNKALIRQLTQSQCHKWAKVCVALDDAKQVRTYMQQQLATVTI